jgi:bacterioferritin-associated ferredoxin
VDLDDTICYCFHISKRKIVNFVRVNQPHRASQLSECGGAGSGCGWCVTYLQRFFVESSAFGMATRDAVIPNDYAQQRAAYIKAGRGKPATGAIPLPLTQISDQPKLSDDVP